MKRRMSEPSFLSVGSHSAFQLVCFRSLFSVSRPGFCSVPQVCDGGHSERSHRSQAGNVPSAQRGPGRFWQRAFWAWVRPLFLSSSRPSHLSVANIALLAVQYFQLFNCRFKKSLHQYTVPTSPPLLPHVFSYFYRLWIRAHNVFRFKVVLLLLDAVRIVHNKPLEGIVAVLKISNTTHTFIWQSHLIMGLIVLIQNYYWLLIGLMSNSNCCAMHL